jgi:hypothetical protein
VLLMPQAAPKKIENSVAMEAFSLPLQGEVRRGPQRSVLRSAPLLASPVPGGGNLYGERFRRLLQPGSEREAISRISAFPMTRPRTPSTVAWSIARPMSSPVT